MKGVWLDNQTIRFRDDLPNPEPGPGEALVRVRRAGICGTDLQLLRGYYPFTGIPGHEFVGEVVSATDDPTWIGRRVVGEINLSCGTCEQCRASRPRHCRRREVLGIKRRNGAFAEHLTLPLANLHPVPDTVPDDEAVFAEPLAAALEIAEQVHIHPSDTVLVIGAGRLGQLIAQTLQASGTRLQVAARYPGQRRLLESRGIVVTGEDQIPEDMADVVVEATGSSDGLAAARRAVRPRGTIVLKSTYKGEGAADLSGMVVDEITLVGSRCGPFQPALELLREGRVSPGILIDGRYPLHEARSAFEAAAGKGAMKVLFEV